VAADCLWPASRGQCPVTGGVADGSISRTPKTEPSGILIDPEPPLRSGLVTVPNAAEALDDVISARVTTSRGTPRTSMLVALDMLKDAAKRS